MFTLIKIIIKKGQKYETNGVGDSIGMTKDRDQTSTKGTTNSVIRPKHATSEPTQSQPETDVLIGKQQWNSNTRSESLKNTKLSRNQPMDMEREKKYCPILQPDAVHRQHLWGDIMKKRGLEVSPRKKWRTWEDAQNDRHIWEDSQKKYTPYY